MPKYNFEALARRYAFGKVRDKIDKCWRCRHRLTIIDSFMLSKILKTKPIANEKAEKHVYNNSWYIKEPWFLRLDVNQLLCFKSLFAKFKDGVYETETIYNDIKTMDMYISREEIDRALSKAYTYEQIDFYEFCYCLSDTPEYWERIMRDRRYAVEQVQNGYTHRKRVFYSAIYYFGFRNSVRHCINYYLFVNERIGHQHFHEQLGLGSLSGCAASILSKLQNRFNETIHKVRKDFESEYCQKFYVFYERLPKKVREKPRFKLQCKCPELEPHPNLQDHLPDRESKVPRFIPPKVYVNRRKRPYTFDRKKYRVGCRKGISSFARRNDLEEEDDLAQRMRKSMSGSDTLLRNGVAKVPGKWDMFFEKISLPTSDEEKGEALNESTKSIVSVHTNKEGSMAGRSEKEMLVEAIKINVWEILDQIGPKIKCWHHDANLFKVATAINNMYRDIRNFKIILPPHIMKKLINVRKGSYEAKQLVNEVLGAYHDQMKQMFLNIQMDYYREVLARLRFNKPKSLENFMLAFHSYSVLQKGDIYVKYPWEPHLHRCMHQKLLIASIKRTETWNKYFSGKNDCLPYKRSQLPLRRCFKMLKK